MIRLKHNRDTYSKHEEMIDWCLDNIGWSAYHPGALCNDAPFHHSQAFGYLFLTFYNDFDAFKFKMQWGGEKTSLPSLEEKSL